MTTRSEHPHILANPELSRDYYLDAAKRLDPFMADGKTPNAPVWTDANLDTAGLIVDRTRAILGDGLASYGCKISASVTGTPTAPTYSVDVWVRRSDSETVLPRIGWAWLTSQNASTTLAGALDSLASRLDSQIKGTLTAPEETDEVKTLRATFTTLQTAITTVKAANLPVKHLESQLDAIAKAINERTPKAPVRIDTRFARMFLAPVPAESAN